MSYFEGQSPRWAQHSRQPSWDPSQASPRPDPQPPTAAEHQSAFDAQFEEVQRASENLTKGSRMFAAPQHGRRGSVPVPGSFTRQYAEFDPRYGGPSRHYSVGGDFEGRSHSSHGSGSLQGYLSNQRFGGPRGSEAEQMMQAKRRAAAQRERELRNYHQEQQYNRNQSSSKSDRSMSPSAMSEEDRRELIARQHRALYGTESNLYVGDGGSPRPMNAEARALGGQPGHAGSSPMTFDGYGAPPSQTPEGQPRSRSNSNASPAATQGQFAMYDSSQPSNNPTSTSSPAGGESPTRAGTKAPSGSGVAPIGTRPAQAKRSTPPQPSPLSFGFNSEKNVAAAERSQSSASNPTTTTSTTGERSSGLGWGSGSSQAPWGSNKVQAPVWG